MFLPPLLRQLKSAKEDVRGNAVTAVESLALRCKDIEVRAPTCISSILLLQSQTTSECCYRHLVTATCELVHFIQYIIVHKYQCVFAHALSLGASA
jgi:hypothetical protein